MWRILHVHAEKKRDRWLGRWFPDWTFSRKEKATECLQAVFDMQEEEEGVVGHRGALPEVRLSKHTQVHTRRMGLFTACFPRGRPHETKTTGLGPKV